MRSSMSIYLIQSDLESYDSLLKYPLAPFDDWWPQQGFESWVEVRFALNGHRVGSRWRPIPVYRYRGSPRRKYAGLAVDFHHSDVGWTAISEHALEVIRPLVGDAVEALPLEVVDHPEQRYYVLHVVDLVDCLDREHVEGRRIAEDAYTDITQYAFRPGTTDGHHLFRLPEIPLTVNLASEEFKQLVEANGLRGLTFDTTDEPIVPPWRKPKPPKAGPKRKRSG
jgi:hypothetical protein